MLDGVPDPRGRGNLGCRTLQAKHAIANCCCHLANRNDERFRPFPDYFGLVVGDCADDVRTRSAVRTSTVLTVPELYGRGAVSATELSDDDDDTDDDDDDDDDDDSDLSDLSDTSSVNRDAPLSTSLLCSQHPGLTTSCVTTWEGGKQSQLPLRVPTLSKGHQPLGLNFF